MEQRIDSSYLSKRIKIVFPGFTRWGTECVRNDFKSWPERKGRIVKGTGNGETLELGGSPKVKAKQTRIWREGVWGVSMRTCDKVEKKSEPPIWQIGGSC